MAATCLDEKQLHSASELRERADSAMRALVYQALVRSALDGKFSVVASMSQDHMLVDQLAMAGYKVRPLQAVSDRGASIPMLISW
jgi:hypothetical protein